MNIGVDVDGVILDCEKGIQFYADYWSYFKRGKERLVFDKVSQETSFGWTMPEVVEFYTEYFDQVSQKSPLMVGAKEILQQLKKDGHKLFIITLRGFYREQEIITGKEKLKGLEVPFDGMHWSVQNKLKVANEIGLDIMIDDNTEVCEQFANTDIKVLHFREAKIRKTNLPNVTEVDSWMDIYREIQKIKTFKAEKDKKEERTK